MSGAAAADPLAKPVAPRPPKTLEEKANAKRLIVVIEGATLEVV
eukprot:SAG31_NODE_32431_length_356_cov_0.603113_1_plen_43_part_10